MQSKLGLAWAIKVFFWYQVNLFAGALAGGVLGGIWLSLTSSGNARAVIAENHTLLLMIGTLLGMSLAVFYLRRLARSCRRCELADDIGLHPAQPAYRGRALVSGAALSLAYLVTAAVFVVHGIRPDGQGEVSKMASDSLPFWTLIAVGFAPWVEENVFRGHLFAGLRARWGTRCAALLVTLLFVALHWGEWRHFPVAAVFITALAVLTMRLRITTGSIQPAIYAHVGYNGGLALVQLLAAQAG